MAAKKKLPKKVATAAKVVATVEGIHPNLFRYYKLTEYGDGLVEIERPGDLFIVRDPLTGKLEGHPLVYEPLLVNKADCQQLWDIITANPAAKLQLLNRTDTL